MINEQIETYLNWCENITNLTEQTIGTKKFILRIFVKQTMIDDIFELDLETFIEWKNGMLSGNLTGRTYGVETINTRLKTLRCFLRWAVEYYERKPKIRPIMIQKIKSVNKTPDYIFYRENEIKYVLKSSPEFEKLSIALLFESGLRISEFRNIKVGDIDFEKGRIAIIGKGRKFGYVYFSFRTSLKLENYIAKNGLFDHDFLWRSPASASGQPLTVKAIRKRLKRQFERCGFNNFHPHQLRHSFATNLAERGADIYEIQQLLRHADIRTTQIYLHHLQNKLGNSYRRIFNEEIYYFKIPFSEKTYV